MAETKNSAPAKFDKDALKEWFTLAEVAARWTRLTGQTFTASDLIHYGSRDILEIGVIADFNGIGMAGTPEEGRVIDLIGYTALRPVLLAKLEQADGQFFDHQIDIYGSIFAPLASYSSRFAFGEFSSPLVHRMDLVITRTERDRFEHEHDINQPGMTAKMPTTDKLDSRIEKTYLQIIRALATEAGYTLETPYKDADTLMKSAASNGLTMPSKRDTIAEKLRDAANLSD